MDSERPTSTDVCRTGTEPSRKDVCASMQLKIAGTSLQLVDFPEVSSCGAAEAAARSVCQLSMDTFSDLLNHLAIEGRQIIRFATSDETIIDNDFLIYPATPSITDVCLNSWPGGQLSATHNVCLDQEPRAVTNGRNCFPACAKLRTKSTAAGFARKVSGL